MAQSVVQQMEKRMDLKSMEWGKDETQHSYPFLQFINLWDSNNSTNGEPIAVSVSCCQGQFVKF